MFKQLFFILILGVPLFCIGQQTDEETKSIHQLSFSVMTESIALPFTRLLPLHPGAEIGLTLKQTEKDRYIQQWNVYLGGYYHQRIETGVYLKGEFNHRFLLHKNLGLDLMGGLGYLHTFYPSELYEQNIEDGEFAKITQGGKPHAIIDAGVGLTFMNDSPIEPFIKQSFTIETPFANGIPIVPHSFLKIGVNVKL